mmetsp:Transcript_1702/g.2413  ORF Transcript_1702/g.2413 Transcript_1702/m.2413 type:complete len:81 (+) Transcript_1702:367-609(+)|eukprot:977601-Amorphochlora_amoeboformis.AAC.2
MCAVRKDDRVLGVTSSRLIVFAVGRQVDRTEFVVKRVVERLFQRMSVEVTNVMGVVMAAELSHIKTQGLCAQYTSLHALP